MLADPFHDLYYFCQHERESVFLVFLSVQLSPLNSLEAFLLLALCYLAGQGIFIRTWMGNHQEPCLTFLGPNPVEFCSPNVAIPGMCVYCILCWW